MNRILAAVFAFVVLPTTANGANYIYELSGVITDFGNLSLPIAVGDAWSYSITVDGDTPDTAGASDQGFYRKSITEVLFQSGSVELSRILNDDNALVAVNNDRSTNPPHDSLWFFVTLDQEYIGVRQIGEIRVNMYDWSATAISSDSLSETLAVEIGDFTIDETTIELTIAGQRGIFGEVTSYSASVIPIPAAAWLFGSALLGLGALKRRKAV
jgi:hypothetical protein